MPKATASKRVQAAKDKTGLLPEDAVIDELEAGWSEGMDQTYELVDVDAIKEHPDNYNVGDEDAIRDSMDTNGWFGAVLVQRSSGYIIAHNHAYRVAKAKGALQVPVIWKDVDDVEALRMMVADNETARRSNPEHTKLDEILGQLGSIDGTGLRGLEELEGREKAREAAEAAEEASKAREGGKDGDDPGFETSFGVVVVCEDEAEQEKVYAFLTENGYKARPVSV